MLPQDDDNIEQRQKELEEKKTIYEFDWRVPGMIPLTKNVPADEEFPKEVKVRTLLLNDPLKSVTLSIQALQNVNFTFNLLAISSWEVIGKAQT